MGIDVPPLSAEISIRSLYPLPTYPLDWALRTTALLTRACGGGDEVFFFFFFELGDEVSVPDLASTAKHTREIRYALFACEADRPTDRPTGAADSSPTNLVMSKID
jgi:hypothetical protein